MRGQAEDLDAVRVVPVDDRLERVEIRADQITQALAVTFAIRRVRDAEGSCVLTHA